MLGTNARTQNGHIRNDTRDVSRRIIEASLGPICRETVSRVIAHVRAYRPETSMVRRGSTVRVRQRAWLQEGVVATRLNEPYRPGERAWVKTKNREYWRWEIERAGALKIKHPRQFV